MKPFYRRSLDELNRKWIFGAVSIFVAVALGFFSVYVQSNRLDGASVPQDVGSESSAESAKVGRLMPDSYYDDPWVYFIGDSYTEGTAADSGRGSLWSSIVCDSRRWYERNLGMDGSGYATNGRDGKNYIGQIQASRLEGADGVVVSGGLNDVARGVSLDELRSRVSQTFTLIRSYAPRVPFTVLSVFNPFPDQSTNIRIMNDILRSEAFRVGAVFVEASDLIRGDQKLLGPGGLELDDQGHAAIAAVVGGQIAEPIR